MESSTSPGSSLMLEVAKAVSMPVVGSVFLEALARQIISLLSAHGGLVGLLDPEDSSRVTTRVFLLDGQQVDDYCYNITHSPCIHVLKGSPISYASDLEALFPLDEDIQKMKLEAYVGVPLINKADEVVGLVAVFYREAIQNQDTVVSVLQIMGSRIMSELERAEVDKRLMERMKELKCLYHVQALTTDHSLTLNQVFDRVSALLPPSLLHPASAVARVVYHEQIHASGPWPLQSQSLRSDIQSKGLSVGFVEIAYPGPGPGEKSLGFLPEEREMLDSVALLLGRMLADREMAELATRHERLHAIGQLTGGVAHDFNNLLTVIIGNSELLADRLGMEPELRDLINSITKAARQGEALTHQLLAYARKQPLNPAPTDLNTLILGMEPLLKRTLGSHIQVITSSEISSPAMVDKGQMESALLNLCLNARDAMPNGGKLLIHGCDASPAELSREWTLPDDTRTYVKVTVEDTGIGMTPALLEKIFEPFFSTKEVGKGTGLGLSMVYGFVKQSQGDVRVHSIPGQGTRVSLILPTAAPEREPAWQAISDGITKGHGQHILLVEDDDLVREFAQHQLQALGYKVTQASDGIQALSLLHGDIQVELLFTDIIMPGGINGRELAERARELRPGLPVLFTSGYTDNTFIHDKPDVGTSLLNKPYTRNSLSAAIAQALEE